MNHLIEEQRKSHQAVIERAKRKLAVASDHLEAAEKNVEALATTIAKAEKALKELTPPEFVPTLKPGSYFPNIYYNDVYNETAGGTVVDRMAQGGLLCENKQDARRISGYLKVMGKLANFVLQANRRSQEFQKVRTGYTIVPLGGDLTIAWCSDTVMPTFNSRDDAAVVLEKHLTHNDKRILFEGI